MCARVLFLKIQTFLQSLHKGSRVVKGNLKAKVLSYHRLSPSPVTTRPGPSTDLSSSLPATWAELGGALQVCVPRAPSPPEMLKAKGHACGKWARAGIQRLGSEAPLLPNPSWIWKSGAAMPRYWITGRGLGPAYFCGLFINAGIGH